MSGQSLKLSDKYELNLNDPRVYKRVAHVLDWCDIYLSSDWNKQVSHKIIDKEFGPRCSALSKWLKYKLLHKLGSYTPNCKAFGKLDLLEYRVNKEGYDELRALLSKVSIDTNQKKKKSRRNKLNEAIIQHSSSNTISHIFQNQFEKYKSEFENDNFIYNTSEKTGRDYHGLQTMKREYKNSFWGQIGYKYNYDIDACAPTVLSQYAEQLGLSSLLVGSIHEYTENKEYHRNRLAKMLDVDVNVIKQIINALFNGAILAANTKCSAYELLDYDMSKMIMLQQDEFIIQLRRHVKNAWNRIRTREKVMKGHVKRWSKGEKWGIYFNLEKIIMNVIYSDMKKNNVCYFNEHDGFRTKVMIDVCKLEEMIRTETGFSIKIKVEENL